MLVIESTTITTVLGWVKELAIIGSVLSIAWKARGLWDDTKQFASRITSHMNLMEHFADAMVNNHLHHIELSLTAMSTDMQKFREGSVHIENIAKDLKALGITSLAQLKLEETIEALRKLRDTPEPEQESN